MGRKIDTRHGTATAISYDGETLVLLLEDDAE